MAYLKLPALETKIFNRLAMMSTLWTFTLSRSPGVTPRNPNVFR